jgi:hypothetical protein
MKVYLSARFGRREEMHAVRSEIVLAGHHVVSRWLEAHDGDDLAVAAFVDLDDLRSSDCLILFSEGPDVGYTTGGRHVELGLAIALHKPVCVIGPRENVFFYLPQICFADDLHTALAMLRAQF